LARIRQFTLKIPPLRERKDDIPLLCNHFIEMFKEENPGFHARVISGDKLNEWHNRNWEMNVRQLKFEVFREMVEESPVELPCNPEFKVHFNDKLSRDELLAEYAQWLKKIIKNHEQIADFLKVSVPTYYRMLKKPK